MSFPFHSRKSVVLLSLPLILILTAFFFSSAHPFLYVMTICVYLPLTALLSKTTGLKTALAVLLLVTVLVMLSRLMPTEQNLNGTDLTVLSFYEVSGGEIIEQDFYLPKSDWRLSRLLNDPDVYAVLRIIGNISNDDAHLLINGEDVGPLLQLLLSKSEPMYSIPNAYNYILKFPKHAMENTSTISVGLTSNMDYLLGYNSGIAPLPESAHARKTLTDGSVIDIASQYYRRRFRFSMVVYLVSKTYFSDFNDPLILGSIH